MGQFGVEGIHFGNIIQFQGRNSIGINGQNPKFIVAIVAHEQHLSKDVKEFYTISFEKSRGKKFR